MNGGLAPERRVSEVGVTDHFLSKEREPKRSEALLHSRSGDRLIKSGRLAQLAERLVYTQ